MTHFKKALAAAMTHFQTNYEIKYLQYMLLAKMYTIQKFGVNLFSFFIQQERIQLVKRDSKVF